MLRERAHYVGDSVVSVAGRNHHVYTVNHRRARTVFPALVA
jgi:hypothetical protein